jgi:hypothetical protein
MLTNTLILALATLNTSPTETADFADVARLVDAELDRGARVLYVTDLDNTILATDQDIGSEHWFLWQKRLIEAGDETAVARTADALLATQTLIYGATHMHPTQAEIPSYVSAFTRRGVGTVVLTSRGLDMPDITQRELTRNGFDFAANAPGPAGGYADTWSPSAGGRPVSYERGVMLTQGQNKGEMLAALLDKTGAAYDAIVFVDDRPHHLEAMASAFEHRPERLYTVLFTNERPEIEAFDASDKSEEIAAWCAFAAGWTALLDPAGRADVPFVACDASAP